MSLLKVTLEPFCTNLLIETRLSDILSVKRTFATSIICELVSRYIVPYPIASTVELSPRIISLEVRNCL
jgi:hypothetical protein